MDKLNKMLDVCEKKGWGVFEYGDYIELRQYSPAGEDFGFTVDRNNFLKEVIGYAEDFDADEHAEMWVENMHNVAGVPQSIRTLIQDADDIQDMLLELAEALGKEG